MAKRNPVLFNTPPGRFIGGSLYRGSTHDAKGVLRVFKNGPNAGQPRVDFSVGIAIPKTKGHWAEEPGWGQTIWAEGHAAWPGGQTQLRDFAWKVQDGDSTEMNGAMKRNCDREGYPGNWILWFGTTSLAAQPKRIPFATAIGSPPQWNDTPDFCLPGDIIEVRGSVVGNEAESPGVYLNPEAVCMRGYHEDGRITSSFVDLATAGFGAAPLPAGASTAPVGNALPPAAPPAPGASPSTPAAPPAPASPVPAPAAPPAPVTTPVTPNAAILGAPAPVTVPPAPAVRMLKNGGVYDDWIKAGWTDDSLRQAGHID